MGSNFSLPGLLLHEKPDLSNIVKKTLLVFPLTTILALSIISTRQKNPGQDLVAGDRKPETGSIAAPGGANAAIHSLAAITVTDEEWNAFRKRAERELRKCQNSLSMIRTALIDENREITLTVGKKIEVIQAKLEFEQARLDAFGKSRINWDVFEPGFNSEVDAITDEIKTLSSVVANQ
jgi:hypothetical protein